MKYRKKPVTIEATQWFKPGDHPEVVGGGMVGDEHAPASIKTLEGRHVVTPGDYIITGVKGEHYPCKPDIFEMTYDRAGPYDVKLVDRIGFVLETFVTRRGLLDIMVSDDHSASSVHVDKEQAAELSEKLKSFVDTGKL